MATTTHLLKIYRAVICVAAVLLLQACTMGGEFLKETDVTNAAGKDEVIIVGTIELTPKLQKDEQELDPSGVIDVMGYGEMNRNRSMIQFNSEAKVDGYKLLMNPELGKVFFFNVPNNNKYMVEGKVVIELGRRGIASEIQLPVWFKIDIKPGDKAVYIGKIKYTRDDFNSITDVELIDDYKNASKQFVKKFGKKYKLRKSLVQKI